MKQSKYLKAFEQLEKELGSRHKLTGANMYVEELVKEELISKGGIVLSGAGNVRDLQSVAFDQPLFVRVLSVGPGFYDEDGKDIPVIVKPGDIVMVATLSVKWLNSFGPIIFPKGERIGLISEDAILDIYEGEDTYEKAIEILKAGAEYGTAKTA